MFARNCHTQKRIRNLGFLLLLLFHASTPAKQTIPEVDHLIERGSYELAYTRLLEMKAKKTSPLLIFTIAQTLEKMQDYASAMIHYQDLMQSFPGSIHESEAREKLKNYFGSYQEEDIYSFKIKIETHLNKGVEKIEEKNFHEGIVHLLRAHNLHGKHYLTSFYLGYAYYALYQTNPKMVDYLDRAIRFYLDAISSRQSPKAYNNLACIFAGQEDEILAHVYFRRALETATKPMEMPGLVKAIQENLDFFSNERKTRKLQFLRELMQ